MLRGHVLIKPEEIERIVFTRALRGYKDTEVDAFLEKVASTLAEVIAERDSFKKQLIELKSATPSFTVEQAQEAEKQAAEIVDHAKKVAEEIIATALVQAQSFSAEQKVPVPGTSGNENPPK
jgi:DivIVA domain-containing protein